jgi:hypothetical protein
MKYPFSIMTRLILVMSGLFLFNACDITDRFKSPTDIAQAYFQSENAGFSEDGLQFLSKKKRDQRSKVLENPIAERAFDMLGTLDLTKDMTLSNEVIDSNKATVDVTFRAGFFEIKTTLTFVRERGWKIDSFGVLDL